jgi:cardiolipin synthase
MDQRLDDRVAPGLYLPGHTPAPLKPADPALDRAFARISGAPLRPGNAVRLLKDAGENYPAWLDAIRSATATIHFETFIVADDATGRLFADALMERAAAGVRVRLLYDWLGSSARAFPSYFARLRKAGVEVRVFSPLRLSSPLWIRRDHRKLLTVDGAVGFVSGLCISDDWPGNPERGVEPWRDTGVELRGPVVADLENAFAEIWALTGPPLPKPPPRPEPAGATAGSVPVRAVVGRPGQFSAYRLDLLIAASARRTLWLTDAYFLASRAYVQALAEAARDGVDVRLLVPAASDVPFLQPIVQAGYRPLVEAGVRVFEWDGPMLHAKTAVADGAWARVGSTNLNGASWAGNWELDVSIEDEGFAAALEAMFLADLSRSTEIVPGSPRERRARRRPGRRAERRTSRRDLRRLAAGAAALGQSAGAAMAGARPLTAVEARSAGIIGAVVLMLAAAVTIFPVLIVSPVVIMLAWIGLALLRRAWRLRAALKPRERRRLRVRREPLVPHRPGAEPGGPPLP